MMLSHRRDQNSSIEKVAKVVFQQDNARPHTSLMIQQKLLQLELFTLPHPPYSLDLTPSDYYLFRTL